MGLEEYTVLIICKAASFTSGVSLRRPSSSRNWPRGLRLLSLAAVSVINETTCGRKACSSASGQGLEKSGGQV